MFRNLKKKILIIILSICIVITNLCISVFANSDDENLLKEKYFSLEKVKFESLNYKFLQEYDEDSSLATERPEFKDGIIGGAIKDFDSDGKSELLVCKMVNVDFSGYDHWWLTNDVNYSNVFLEMYEVESGKVILKDTSDYMMDIFNISDFGGLEFFLKNNYIIVQLAKQNNTFADGANGNIHIYSYNGNGFINELDFHVSGSSVPPNPYLDEEAISIKKLGFVDFYNLIKDGYSPYFQNINLAIIEKGIERLAEILITNNGEEVFDVAYSKFDDFEESHKYIRENKIMTITYNDFTSIEKQISKSISYIYNDTEKDVDIPIDELNAIENAEDVEKAVNEAISTLTSEEKNSANGADKVILFGEEAIVRAATLKTDSDEIVINDSNMSELVDKATEAEEKVLKVLSAGSVKRARKTNVNAKIVTSNSGKVSISKEKLSKNIDNVKVETPYAGVSFSAKAVSDVSVENKGTNKISVNFGNKNTSEKIKISFPNMARKGDYMAVVDEKGNPVGGKYNPITGELTAKIDVSGVYSVVNNEKDFSDIKSKSAEMQEAIKLLVSKGIINGTSETEFSPDKSISRAEVAAIILRTLSKLDENADGGFSDVIKSNWFYGTAGSAKNAGIINGYEDNTFRGNVVIPKVQIVSVSARVLKNEMGYYDVSDVEKALSGYGDRSAIAKWAEGDVALATDANMVIKRTDGLFGGTAEMTRGDAAIILKRLFDKIW